MTASEDDAAAIHSKAAKLEEIAEYLERTMPRLRRVRELLGEIAPGASRHSGYGESVDRVDQFDAAAAEDYGFTRAETARARIASAVADPIVARPDPQ
jgi:hypothetical protein